MLQNPTNYYLIHFKFYNIMLKKIKKLQKKLLKTQKQINIFFTKTIKNHKTMIANLKKIWVTTLFIVCLTACGTTKVSVQKPAEGTSTTITVTTNNPITTNTPITNELNK